MGQKVTNDDVANFIKKHADTIDSELELEFRVAYSHMVRSEQELIDTYTEKQIEIYKEFLDARQKYYDLFIEKYKRNI